ncbi:MAG: tetratricopeptide repeat protein [Bacteroidia bacterium]|nr:tetratricopeptide repeat protein [Bacteroidia bacterium]
MSKKNKKKTTGPEKRPDVKSQLPLNNSSHRKFYIGALFIISVLLYANTLHNEFALDDAVVITNNRFTQQGLKGIPDLLTKDLFTGIYGKALDLSGGRYRPLSLVLFAVEYELFGKNAFVGHLTNVLFYALIGIIIFLTIETIFENKSLLAFVTALIFVLHPIHTEVVANIKSLDEILSLLFLLLTMLWLFKGVRTGIKKYTYLGCLAYFLSLMAKENGITFMFIIPLSLYCFTGDPLKKNIRDSIPYFIVAVVFVLIRWHFVGIIGDRTNPDIMENPFVNATLGDKLATISCILGKYLWLLFFPHPLSSEYSFNQIPIIGWSSISALFPFVIYTGLSGWALFNIRKRESVKEINLVLSFCILFFIATVFLVSNIVFNIGAPMGERFLFLPSLAFCIAISALLLNVLKIDMRSLKLPLKLILPLAFISLAFSYKTVTRNKDWYDDLSLFAKDVKSSPNSAKVHYYYGNVLLGKANAIKEMNPEKQQYLLKAKNEMIVSVGINPKFHHAFYALGLICDGLELGDSSIYYFNKVLELQPTHIATQNAIGKAYGKIKGDFDKAIFYLLRAVQYDPTDAEALENLGIAYAMKGNTSEAIKIFEKALTLKPGNAQSYLNLGVAYHNIGDQKKSDEMMNKAYQLDPSLKKK